MIEYENADNTRVKRNFLTDYFANRPMTDVALIVKNVTVQIE